MTIAIGYRCQGGVIVAADTLAIVGDSEAYEGKKLDEFWVRSGSYAVVNASNDGHATASLVDDIKHALDIPDVQDYRNLAGILKHQMIEWKAGFKRRKPPAMQMIVAAGCPTLIAVFWR